jgi:hypothetical protein
MYRSCTITVNKARRPAVFTVHFPGTFFPAEEMKKRENRGVQL